MWVQLTSLQRLEKQGKMVTYHPGDWVEVGKQTAQLWLARGEARVPANKRPELDKGASVVVITGQPVEGYIKMFRDLHMELPVSVTEVPCLTSLLTLVWEPTVALRPELLSVGFNLLDKWELACPLRPYNDLAKDAGNEADRARTVEVVRDLRVPLYDTRLMFMRDCHNVRILLGRWNAERYEDGDESLAFLRAFYTVKPLMLALPVTWVTPGAYAEIA